MTKYPKRVDAHTKETEAMAILKSQLPSKWMIRETTERDYGVDCYVEIVTKDGDVIGEILSGQLKGTSKLNWEEKPDGKQETISPSIKIETVNYWMSLPVPVFLLVADLSEKNIYFASVELQVRKQYRKYLKQASLSFKLYKMLNIGTEQGLGMFLYFHYIEKNHDTFVSALRMLLIHWETYLSFIQGMQHLDCFMEAEPNEELMFIHLYRTLQTLSSLLGIDWTVASLSDIIKNDKEKWKDFYCTFHYLTFTEVLPFIEKKFYEVIQKARKRITIVEKEYWEAKELIIYRIAEGLGYLKPGYCL